ncbi:uncharacterized protein LOC125947340 isoform X2 [Dermacentor silvarum]|uniref:uncharacterized protein LOC125947340 isoform X2 n=1 Tax=Dermacentor silvarum TaxID=543639 RepID=UPI002100C482|nr:uncharacterized protein LOC125947340 isoform X2 [Dermacentor silvarum]
MTGDFLTTAFPVVLVLVASDKFGGEQTLTLEVFPEFKRYNVSLWKSHGGECGDTASLNMVSWKHEYLEADPITVRCFPSEFCSRLTTSTFHIKGIRS